MLNIFIGIYLNVKIDIFSQFIVTLLTHIEWYAKRD